MRNIVNVYSFWGMVWVQALEMVPLIYLLLSASFQAMDPRLEEASTMTGAGNWRTLRRISLPLALPAVAAALLLLFVTTIETFEVPLLMGGRAGLRVYTTEIFYDTSRTPIDWGLASTYSMALLVVAIVLLFLYFRLIRHGERYQTITGKDFRPRRIDLGPLALSHLRDRAAARLPHHRRAVPDDALCVAAAVLSGAERSPPSRACRSPITGRCFTTPRPSRR